MAAPIQKTELLLGHIRRGDWAKALSLANTFRMLPRDVLVAIRKGHAARTNPRLYRGLGHDPELLVEQGKAALQGFYAQRLATPAPKEGLS